MGFGFAIGGLGEGFARGVSIGSKLASSKRRQDREDRLDAERVANRAEDVAYRNKGLAIQQQNLDLNRELKHLQINAAKDKNMMARGKFVSKAIRSAMTNPDGSRITPEQLKTMNPDDVQSRFDTIHQGMVWMANKGGFLKNYLGTNKSGSLDTNNPVAGFTLMQSDQGNMGVLTHLNRKDGTTGILDHPNRADGQGTVIPGDVFSDMAWRASGMFLDGKLSEQQKLTLQNKNAMSLENLKHKNRLSEQGSKPESKTEMRQNMEYLVQAGVAKNPREALKIVQRAKSNPTKLIMDQVSAAEENQTAFGIKPGDPRYRSRSQIISDSMSLIDQINGRSAPQGQQESPDVVDTPGHGAPRSAPAEQAPQQAQGGLPPQALSALKEGAVTTFGNGQSWTIQNGQPVQVK